jgi:WD40 repeat protein
MGATSSYGMLGANLFGFSPDGQRIVTPPDEYLLSGYGEYASSDGQQLVHQKSALLARDQSWSRELVYDTQSIPGLSDIVDRASGATLLAAYAYPAPNALSGDGSSLVTVQCTDALELVRTEIPSGARTSVTSTALNCNTVTMVNASSVPLAVNAAGTLAIFGIDTSGKLWLADFSAGTLEARTVYSSPGTATPRLPANTMVTSALSPSGRSLAVVAVGQPLRVLSYPGLAPLLPDLPVSIGEAFIDCYCSTRSFSPVAWSPDERLLASADEQGNLSIRRACDGAPLASIDAGADQVLAYLAFSPDGRALATLRIQNVTLTASVTYYDLTY